jgi:hypothetical protein
VVALEDCGNTSHVGTAAWRNWHAFNDGEPELEYYVDELHSTAEFAIGQADFGPYELTAVMREGRPRGAGQDGRQPTVGLSLLLKGRLHANLIVDIVKDGELVGPDTSTYYGGTISDEVAALASLCTGIPIRCAGTRMQSGIHEHMDRPDGVTADDSPLLVREVRPLTTPQTSGWPRLPRIATRPAHLDQLARLATIPFLAASAQIALVRAARAYASGIWIADEDPNLAWLQLVTAIEVAATHAIVDRTEPAGLLAELWPELSYALEPAPDDVRAAVSKQLARQVRAAKKFKTFIETYAPEPPSRRPQFDRLDWTRLSEAAGTIYKHRSLALHEGIPMPLPMLGWPRPDGDAEQETPGGLSSGGADGIWMAADAPMLLATFEYIAREALLRWWDQMTPDDVTRDPASAGA